MINSYKFGSIVIDGKEYTADVKIIGGNVIANWWRKEGHSICKEDILDVLDAQPEVFVLGTGAYGLVVVPRDFKAMLKAQRIELVAKPTAKAVEAYNSLARTRNVAAGFHLTC